MTAPDKEFTSNQIKALRAETPGATNRLHFDNCGASLMPLPVLKVLRGHIDLEAKVGGYVAHEQQFAAHERVYGSLAALLGGEASNYALTSSAVDAWNKAFYSVALKPGDNIITAFNEYCSNYVAFLQQAQRHSAEVRVAEAGDDGALDLTHLESLIDQNTRLIAIAHVPSSSGQVNPVVEVGNIAKKHNVLYLLDACQAVGQMCVDVDEIGCDMLTGTSRKFMRGPRGVGFLYISDAARNMIEPAMLSNQAAAWVSADRYELRNDARIFEDWERNVADQLAFGAALDYLLALGPKKVFARTQSLAATLRTALYDTAGVAGTCPDNAKAAIVTFNKAGMTAPDVKAALEQQGIGVQVASVMHTRLDLEARGIESTVRVSPHYYNTEDEIERFVAAVRAL